MTKKDELNEKDLEDVAGGCNDTMRINCPCGCNREWTASGRFWPSNGTVLGKCGNGFKCVINGLMEADFINEETGVKYHGTFRNTY